MKNSYCLIAINFSYSMLQYSRVLPGVLLVEQEGIVVSLHLGDFLGRLEFCLLSHQLLRGGVNKINLPWLIKFGGVNKIKLPWLIKFGISPSEPNELISRE